MVQAHNFALMLVRCTSNSASSTPQLFFFVVVKQTYRPTTNCMPSRDFFQRDINRNAFTATFWSSLSHPRSVRDPRLLPKLDTCLYPILDTTPATFARYNIVLMTLLSLTRSHDICFFHGCQTFAIFLLAHVTPLMTQDFTCGACLVVWTSPSHRSFCRLPSSELCQLWTVVPSSFNPQAIAHACPLTSAHNSFPHLFSSRPNCVRPETGGSTRQFVLDLKVVALGEERD